MDKYFVAQVLREIAFVIELTDENPKKAIAYRKAAVTVEEMDQFEKHVKEKTLEAFPRIGNKIAGMIIEIVKTGKLAYHDELIKKIPKGMWELSHLPGLSTTRLRLIYEKLGITNLQKLEQAIQENTLSSLKGFGPSYLNKLQKQMRFFKQEFPLLYPTALRIAEHLWNLLKEDCLECEIVGQLRRKCELINEIKILCVTKKRAKCFKTISQHNLVEKIINSDESLITVLLKQGITAKLHFVEIENFALEFFKLTGNEKHLETIEKMGLKKNPKTEQEIYTQLKLQYIEPELREGFDEIKAAKKNQLPHLILAKDLKGTFHCHTLESDGINTLEEMAEAAKKRGWSYLGIADHSKSSYQAHGMDEERLFKQLKEIKALNKKESNFQIFSGIECDILKDGSLDFSDDVLKQLDYVIVSVHRYFNMEEKEMTKRIIKAVENPYTTIVGHLSGRLLRTREPYQINISKIIDACIANNKIIEINASPNRLDMDWRYWINAKQKGLKCCINPDAHSLRELDFIQYGINVARKGWLEKEDVINTLSLKEVKKLIAKI